MPISNDNIAMLRFVLVIAGDGVLCCLQEVARRQQDVTVSVCGLQPG
jgi:hypothetical protein